MPAMIPKKSYKYIINLNYDLKESYSDVSHETSKHSKQTFSKSKSLVI